jgi:hypothetical protein
VRFYAQAPGFGVFLTPEKAVLSLTKGERGAALEMRFIGANPGARIVPSDRGDGAVNYITGSGTETGLPTYGEVTYRDLWPGIDMVFRGQGGRLKYEFHVAPGADPSRIKLAYAGTEGLALAGAGALLVGTPLGTLRDSRPVTYQRVGGKRVPVESRFVLHGANAYGFTLGARDASRPLVIDPALVYSTYLGGVNTDRAHGVAVEPDGTAYVTGYTNSVDFPTTPGAHDTTRTHWDVFVTKLTPSGSLVYSTYLGGNFADQGRAIAIDDSGSAYVTGYTGSSDFPITPGALDSSPAGYDAFITKLLPDGSGLAYSTFFGGGGVDEARGIAVGADGDAYITGRTDSVIPTTPGAFDRTYQPAQFCDPEWDFGDAVNAFVTRIDTTGSALVYSTFLGGEGDSGEDIAVDDAGHAFVTGITFGNFPTTEGAFDRTSEYNGCSSFFQSFVTKFNPTGTALAYSTFIGDSTFGSEPAIAIDPTTNAYVVGHTGSADFPTTPGAADTTRSGSTDAYVTKLNSTGSALHYSTYLGGAGSESGHGIALASDGTALVTGSTTSADFPRSGGAFDTSINSGADAYLTKVSPSGSSFAYSTYLGGGDSDQGNAVGRDASGRAIVVGETRSLDYPTTPGAVRPTNVFTFTPIDGFVTSIEPVPDGYVRPKAAGPLQVSLVPAYNACTAPNRQHGPPLAFGSCNPPARASDEATLGTPDANTKPAKGEGHVTFAAINGIPATPADEADVRITFELGDIYDDPALTDYTGELRARVALRITDKLNNPGDNGTVADTTVGVTVPCAATGDTTVGATCNLDTAIDAVIPGAVPEGKRSVWELGQVQVDDGGADGDADTPGDNTLFLVQGVFVP